MRLKEWLGGFFLSSAAEASLGSLVALLPLLHYSEEVSKAGIVRVLLGAQAGF